MHADQDIFQHRHLGKQTNRLERPGDAAPTDLVWTLTDEVDGLRVVVEQYASGVWAVQARDAVKERRLSAAIGPNDGDDRAPGYVQIDLVQRDEPAETTSQTLYLENKQRGGPEGRTQPPTISRAARRSSSRSLAPWSSGLNLRMAWYSLMASSQLFFFS